MTHLDVTPSAVVERERAILALYAFHSAQSAGRKHPEPPHPYRSPFQRDRDRITHCAAFRRLSNKTQVFTGEMGDYHRTRLTHTLEVASIARTLGRALRLNEDLIEALALAHDLGHPPFGHTGEEALAVCLRAHGGFNHNRHGLRIVEELERRGAAFPGLNLTFEVLAGQQSRAEKGRGGALLEVQVVDAADSVAYDTHDTDDALHVGLLTIEELLELPLWREAARRVSGREAGLTAGDFRRAVLHELIDWQVGDLLETASREIAELGLDSVAAVRAAPVIIRPRGELAEQKLELERFLFQRVYRHPKVQAYRTQAAAQIEEMFERLIARPDLLPPRFQARVQEVGLERGVGDYLAGMTDRYAQEQHRKLCQA